jgi:hypothetical protein
MIAKMPAAGFASIAIPLLGHRKTPTAAAAVTAVSYPTVTNLVRSHMQWRNIAQAALRHASAHCQRAAGGNNVAKWHGRTAIQHHGEHFKG